MSFNPHSIWRGAPPEFTPVPRPVRTELRPPGRPAASTVVPLIEPALPSMIPLRVWPAALKLAKLKVLNTAIEGSMVNRSLTLISQLNLVSSVLNKVEAAAPRELMPAVQGSRTIVKVRTRVVSGYWNKVLIRSHGVEMGKGVRELEVRTLHVRQQVGDVVGQFRL